MEETHAFLVPDYYPKFSCKMGKCRSACCEGWPITLSMRDYFRLLGVACSKPLRIELDCAMHILPNATPQAYARINPTWKGTCPMRRKDGRCGVHAELGPDALADVCRLYPRAIHTDGAYECSCANSCEAVLDLMFSSPAPIRFLLMNLTMDLPDAARRTVFFETMGREQKIRLYFIGIIQNRTFPLPQRLLNLGTALHEMEIALNDKNEMRVDALLSGLPLHSPQFSDLLEEASLLSMLGVVERMVEAVDERSASVHRYGKAALARFQSGRPMDSYVAVRRHFEKALPQWHVYLEHLLVNHMFFERFPFQDRPESLSDEFIAICAVYAMLRFLGMGWMADKQSMDDFIDVAAAAFRFISHTSFDRYAAHLLKTPDSSEKATILNLLLI